MIRLLKSGIVILIILSVIVSSGGCKRQRTGTNSIQVKGSDTMVNLGQAWAEAYMNINPAVSIAVTGGGSGTGISAMINNTCGIAEVSRDMKPSEITLAKNKGFEPVEFKVALDGLAVVAHPSNPVDRLTIDELADVFAGKIKNWQEIGGRDAEIVLLSREVNSGTHLYFKEHILRKGNSSGTEEFSPKALLLPSSQAIADEVVQNPDAIGYYGMGYLSDKQKALNIAKDKNSPYVAPTIENVMNNSYPISRPLLIYTRGKPTGVIKEFIDFILSPAGQQIVKELDFVPVIQL